MAGSTIRKRLKPDSNTARDLHQDVQPTVDPEQSQFLDGVDRRIAAVWLMMAARTRFLWFPLHPLGYIAASAYPISAIMVQFALSDELAQIAGNAVSGAATPTRACVPS